jgi:sec-independent protein translocase protein TatA
MFGMGAQELMIILAICFILFGGKRLPEIGAGLGKGITAFKKGLRAREENTALVQEKGGAPAEGGAQES